MQIKNILITILLLVFAGMVLFKVFVLDYTPSTVLPETGYKITMQMEIAGHGENVNIKAMLPVSSRHQDIFDEQFLSGDFNYSHINIGDNRIGKWKHLSAKGKQEIKYTFNAICKEITFVLPDKLPINKEKAPKQ